MPCTAPPSPCSHLLWFTNNTCSEKDFSLHTDLRALELRASCVCVRTCVHLSVCLSIHLYGRLAGQEHHAGGMSATRCPENLKANRADP